MITDIVDSPFPNCTLIVFLLLPNQDGRAFIENVEAKGMTIDEECTSFGQIKEDEEYESLFNLSPFQLTRKNHVHS